MRHTFVADRPDRERSVARFASGCESEESEMANVILSSRRLFEACMLLLNCDKESTALSPALSACGSSPSVFLVFTVWNDAV